MSSNDYVPNRINNGMMPDFGPMGSVTTGVDAPVERTPIEPIRVTPQQNINYVVGQPTAVIPPSQDSPAVREGK